MHRDNLLDATTMNKQAAAPSTVCWHLRPHREVRAIDLNTCPLREQVRKLNAHERAASSACCMKIPTACRRTDEGGRNRSRSSMMYL